MQLYKWERIRGKFLNFAKYNKQKIWQTPRYLLTKRVRSFLKQNRDLQIGSDELAVVKRFLRYNLVEVFNDPFVFPYNFRRIQVFWDEIKTLWFVYTSTGKRLYFKRGLSREKVVVMYNSLCKEQDIHSPHHYFFEELHLSGNSVVADIGVAEGNFGLEIIDKVKELYLFECEEAWIEALEATFEPWKAKVHIVNSFVSDRTSPNSIRLDDFFHGKQVPDLLKLDVEGAEAQVLHGGKNLLRETKITELLVCTYHQKGDAENLSEKLIESGYSITFSAGYMLFLNGGLKAQPPYDFRKGLLHAVRVGG